MTLADILDGSFKLFRANFRAIVILTALFVVPVDLVAAFLQRSALGGASLLQSFLSPIPPSQTGTLVPTAGDLVAILGTSLFNLVTMPFVAGMVSRVAGDSYLGRPLEWGEALRRTARRFWTLLGSYILVHLVQFSPLVLAVVVLASAAVAGDAALTALGLLLLLAALLVVLAPMALYLVVSPAVVLADLGAVASMRRSWRLVQPRFWPVLGIAVLSGVAASAVGWALGSPFQFGAVLVGYGVGWPLLALSSIIPKLVAIPFVAIVATLVYYDLRIRHEGFDLELIAAGLGGDRGPLGQGGDRHG